MANHLGNLKRMFFTKEINNRGVKNSNETHFISSRDNGRTMGFAGKAEVMYMS